jgi:hypothetical protein
MTKSLSLKLEETVFEEAEKLLKVIKIPRNAYINKAVNHYNHLVRKKIVSDKLKRESLSVKKNSMEVLKEFESTLKDDLWKL